MLCLASFCLFSLVTQVLWLDEEHIQSDVSSNLEGGLYKQLPQQTSPHPSFATEVMEDSAIMTWDCIFFL